MLDSCRDVIERQKTVSYITAYLNNIVPGGKAGEVPSGGFVPSFDGLGRFLGLSDDLGQIFYNSAKIATKEVFLNP